MFVVQENPERANGHIFNVGNPNNEVTVRQLAEMMTEVRKMDQLGNYENSLISLSLVLNSQNKSCFRFTQK